LLKKNKTGDGPLYLILDDIEKDDFKVATSFINQWRLQGETHGLLLIRPAMRLWIIGRKTKRPAVF